MTLSFIHRLLTTFNDIPEGVGKMEYQIMFQPKFLQPFFLQLLLKLRG